MSGAHSGQLSMSNLNCWECPLGIVTVDPGVVKKARGWTVVDTHINKILRH